MRKLRMQGRQRMAVVLWSTVRNRHRVIEHWFLYNAYVCK